MSAIALLPGVFLVGSGAAGFDLTDPLDCHVYLVVGSRAWAIIDAGSGQHTQRIVDNIREVAFSGTVDLAAPGHLLLTHGHADHAGGTGDLLAEFPSLTAWAGQPVAAWVEAGDALGISLDRGKASGAYPQGFEFRAAAPVRSLLPEAEIDLGGRVVRVIDAPGHAAGHLCYLLTEVSESDGLSGEPSRILFSGDTVFTRGRISLQNLHDVDVPAYALTLAALDTLAVDALLPGHYSVSLADGGRHVRAACEQFEAGRVPANAP